MKKLPILKPGDTVEIIAPASRCTDQQLQALKELLFSWQLNCRVAEDIFGEDLLCANSDEMRFKHLKLALQSPEVKAIFCARGGYGASRIMPELIKLTPVSEPKIFVGISDITALHLYLQQQWCWPTIHAVSAPDRFSSESIASLKAILFGEREYIEFPDLVPMNKAAKSHLPIEGNIIGGNLCLIQTGLGTPWQMKANNKIILLEEVSERGYRVDRMLEHLQQAKVFEGAVAIILGDFLEGEEANGSSMIEPVLNRFASNCKIPVLRIKNIGHGYHSFAMPLGVPSKLEFGEKIRLFTKR